MLEARRRVAGPRHHQEDDDNADQRAQDAAPVEYVFVADSQSSREDQPTQRRADQAQHCGRAGWDPVRPRRKSSCGTSARPINPATNPRSSAPTTSHLLSVHPQRMLFTRDRIYELADDLCARWIALQRPRITETCLQGGTSRHGASQRRTDEAGDDVRGREVSVWATCTKLPPRTGGVRLEREEMVQILEEIIRDPDTNATARCTAIRTLRETRSRRRSTNFCTTRRTCCR